MIKKKINRTPLYYENTTNYKRVSAWFLGTKAENANLMSKMINSSIDEHVKFRREHYLQKYDTSFITRDLQHSKEYKESVDIMEKARLELCERLKGSIPFFSSNYQAHMNWDTLIPGNVGYITAMLHNQNNVATEGGTATCQLEKEVGEQLCNLMEFDKNKSWGHITADGTIANIEAMWVARNLKFYPLAIKEAFLTNDNLKFAKENFHINVFDQNLKKTVSKLLVNCTTWELLNINSDEITLLPDKIDSLCHFKNGVFEEYVTPLLLQTKGLFYYARKYPEILNMKVFVSATNHYSWPKAATLLGLGRDSVVGIPVDDNCRMDMEILEQQLELCNRERIPVLMIVAVIGTTMEGVVDNLDSILQLRKKYSKSGINFNLHADAAWGGYLKTMLLEPKPSLKLGNNNAPVLPLSLYARKQFKMLKYVDTITIDPHKAGFIPYSAGSLCYRNGLQRYFISINANYIHSDDNLNMGIFGLEGSKSGATAAAVWLAHKSVPLDASGYGQILGECEFSTKLYYCYWLTLANEDDNFGIQPLIPLPEKIMALGNTTVVVEGKENILNYIKENIIGKTNKEISENPDSIALLQQIGADVLINSFIVNFKVNGQFNRDLTLLNLLNTKLFDKFSITTPEDALSEKVKYILTSSILNSNEYTKVFKRISTEWNLNCTVTDNYSMCFLINTILQPWPNTLSFVQTIMTIFKEGIQECIAQLPMT